MRGALDKRILCTQLSAQSKVHEIHTKKLMNLSGYGRSEDAWTEATTGSELEEVPTQRRTDQPESRLTETRFCLIEA